MSGAALVVEEIARLLAPDEPVDVPTTTPSHAPTTEDELRGYVYRTWGVRVPNVRVCPHHTTPWRAFADAFFARQSVTIWKASRGFGGKSFLLALLSNTEAVALHARVNLLGGSGEQAERVLETMSELWNHPNAPRELLLSEPAKRQTKFRAQNWVRALMASTRSARGPHPQRLRMDEVDEMTMPILDAAMGQTMAQHGVPAQTVLSSTHHYADRTMTEVLKRGKEKDWPVYEWCYRECLEPHGWLALGEVGRKKNEVTQAMWDAEYEVQEPNPEGRAIDPEAVERMFDPALGTFATREGQELILEEPEEGASYATGSDWAKKKDWTIIVTYRTDVKPMRVVAFLRTQRRPWPEMVARLDDRVSKYPGPAAHDATGIGDVIAGYLKCDAEAVILVGRERTEVFAGHIQSIEHDEVRSPRIDFLYGEHKYVTSDDLYGAGHPPDSFVACALARRASENGGFFNYVKQRHQQRQQAKKEGATS